MQARNLEFLFSLSIPPTRKYMDVDLKLDAASAEVVVEGALEKLLMLDRSILWNNRSYRDRLTPDDQLSPVRSYFRDYFRGQSLHSLKSLTPTPSLSRSPTPTQDTQNRLKNGFGVVQLPRKSKKCTIKQVKWKRNGISTSRTPIRKNASHSMITRARAHSLVTPRFFDLEHPPSSKEICR